MSAGWLFVVDSFGNVEMTPTALDMGDIAARLVTSLLTINNAVKLGGERPVYLNGFSPGADAQEFFRLVNDEFRRQTSEART